METVKIGIIGVGGIGSAHLNCIASGKISGMELAAVCDIDEKRLEYARSVCPGLPCFSDYREMIKSGLIDSALVSIPHPLHAETACEALSKGLNVLVEKPEDITVGRARALNETAKKSGKVFGIMFNQRTNPLYARAREIVSSGGIGELKRTVWVITNWYRTQSYYDSGGWRATWSGEGGGVLLNQAPHNLDLWQWICGKPCEITAFCDEGKWHKIDVEDDATIFARYKNGATGVFITSTGELPGTNRLEISGSRGSVVIERGRLTYKKLRADEREVCLKCKESWPQAEYDEEIYEPKSSGKAHAGILQNFADAVLRGGELLAPGYEGINELEISNAAYLSSWTGKSVSLPMSKDDESEFERRLFERQKRESAKKPPESAQQTHKTYSERWEVRF